MSLSPEYFITHLELIPHPEGGYFKETYRSAGQIKQEALPNKFIGSRNLSTAIYFLIEAFNFSAFHKIMSDEMWHFYHGDPLEVVEISENGVLKITTLGSDLEKGEVFQHIVPANTWFGSRVKTGGKFSLVGCTVSPGFDFADFVLAERESLITLFPRYEQVIRELTRN